MAKNNPGSLPRCTFRQLSPVEVECSRCGRVLLTRHPPQRCHALCGAPDKIQGRVDESYAAILTKQHEADQHAEATRQAAVALDVSKLATQAAAAGSKVAGRARGSSEIGLLKLAATLGVAVVQQTAAGWPMRTKDEIAEILETKCKPCEKFTGDHCAACGCKVNAAKFMNKLAWGTQHCPLKLW